MYFYYDKYHTFQWRQECIKAMNSYLEKYNFEYFASLTFKKKIRKFETAKNYATKWLESIETEYPDLELSARIFTIRDYFGKVHLHILMSSNQNRSFTLQDLTNENLNKIVLLHKDGDNHLKKKNSGEKLIMKKIYSNNVYDYISRKNLKFYATDYDNWDMYGYKSIRSDSKDKNRTTD